MSPIRTRLAVAFAAALALATPAATAHARAAGTPSAAAVRPAAAQSGTTYTAAQVLAAIQQNSTSATQVNTKPHINTMTRAMNVNVYQPTAGVYVYTSSMAIDDDGSDPDPDPDHQDQTTFQDSSGAQLGAHHVPYYVLGDDCWDKTTPCPHFFYKEHGISGRQFALIFYNGNVIGAIFGDTQTGNSQTTSSNDSREVGEASVKAASLLGIPSSGTTGGVDNGVTVAILSGPSWVVNGTNANLSANAQGMVQNALNTLGSSMAGSPPPPTNDFSVAVSPASGSVTAGSSTAVSVGTSVTSGSAESVALSASGLPSGATASFSPASVNSGASSTLTVATSAATPAGTYPITVTGTASSGSHTASYTLTVAPAGSGGCTSAQLLANPGFESGATSWTQTSTLGFTPITKATSAEPAHSGSWIADFNGNGSKDTDTVAQSVTIPAGCTASLSYWLHVDSTESTTTAKPDTFTTQVLNSAGTVLGTVGSFSNLDSASGYTQVNADLSAYAGQTVTLKFSGTETDTSGGTTNFVVDDTALNLSGSTSPPPTNDFSVSDAPASGSVTAGASATSTVTTAVTSGSAQSVALSASGLPAGATASFSPASVTAGGASTLTIATASTTPAGTYTVTVTGAAASGSHTTTLTLTVTAPSGGCTSAQLLANPGFESGATSWTQTSTLGFTPITKATSAEPAHSGSWIADFNGNGSKDTDTASQSVTIPAGCTASLSYWLNVDSTESTTTATPDTFTVQVLNSAGTVLGTVGSYSNLDNSSGYTQFTADLSAYAGQTVTLKFTGTETDTSGGTTNFVLDDTALTTS